MSTFQTEVCVSDRDLVERAWRQNGGGTMDPNAIVIVTKWERAIAGIACIPPMEAGPDAKTRIVEIVPGAQEVLSKACSQYRASRREAKSPPA